MFQCEKGDQCQKRKHDHVKWHGDLRPSHRAGRARRENIGASLRHDAEAHALQKDGGDGKNIARQAGWFDGLCRRAKRGRIAPMHQRGAGGYDDGQDQQDILQHRHIGRSADAGDQDVKKSQGRGRARQHKRRHAPLQFLQHDLQSQELLHSQRHQEQQHGDGHRQLQRAALEMPREQVGHGDGVINAARFPDQRIEEIAHHERKQYVSQEPCRQARAAGIDPARISQDGGDGIGLAHRQEEKQHGVELAGGDKEIRRLLRHQPAPRQSGQRQRQRDDEKERRRHVLSRCRSPKCQQT